MLSNVGTVEKAELVDDGDDNQWKRGIVTYELKEEAQAAMEKFHESNFEGARLQIICPEQGQNSPLKQNKPRSRKGSAVDQGRKSSEESNFPVRLVVPSTMIGAIIGKEGKTIRRITDSTGARVDIHRKDNAHSLKKEITVFGNAETCNQAISMILKIIQDERATLSKPAVSSYKSAVLELLAHNDLLQKIFGQRYAGLIDLMQRTSTEITITQTDELGKKATQDRHVIIEGSPEDCCAAQREISEMYNSAFERDMLCIMNMTKNAVQQRDSSFVDHQISRQMNQNRGGVGNMHPHQIQKMKYAAENQAGKLMTSPPHMPPPPPPAHHHQLPAGAPLPPISQLSPNQANTLLHLLSEIRQQQQHKEYYQQHQQHHQISDQLREQLVLAGQLIASDYITKSPQPTAPYQKFSTPKHPVLPGEHPSYMNSSPQGYSPFRYNKPPAERSPSQMKQHTYNDERLNMMSMLEGLDDIFGSQDHHVNRSHDHLMNGSHDHHVNGPKNPMFDASHDSGIQASPQQMHGFGFHGKQAGSPYWQGDDSLSAHGGYHAPNSHGGHPAPNVHGGHPAHNFTSLHNTLNSTGNSSENSSTAQTPEELSFYNGSYSVGACNSQEEEDFLSNSLLRTTWSTQDDNLGAANTATGATFENSNLRRELQSDLSLSDKTASYPNNTGPLPAYPPTPQTPVTPTAGIGPFPGTYEGQSVPGSNNLMKWTNFIPLVIGQKIESVKPSLEQMTRTKISLTPHPHNETVAIIKAVGTSEGTQMLQNNVQLACKQLVQSGM